MNFRFFIISRRLSSRVIGKQIIYFEGEINTLHIVDFVKKKVVRKYYIEYVNCLKNLILIIRGLVLNSV